MNNAASIQSISLYYREGSSDKVYHVQLHEAEGGYTVNFQYGRRGSTLQTGTKTTTPVSRSQAETIFAKLVAEKKSKGYTEGADGTPYTGVEQDKEPSGYLPQLSNFIEEDKALSLLDDVDWFMQEKADGARQLIQRTSNTVTAANRKGLVIPISRSIEDAVRSIKVKGNAD